MTLATKHDLDDQLVCSKCGQTPIRDGKHPESWTCPEERVTRRQAIDHFARLESAVANEYYVGQGDHDAGEAELVEAFRALGVTEEEYPA